MKDSTNECQFAEGQEDVLHMRVCDLTRHLAALIRLDKLADWRETPNELCRSPLPHESE